MMILRSLRSFWKHFIFGNNPMRSLNCRTFLQLVKVPGESNQITTIGD